VAISLGFSHSPHSNDLYPANSSCDTVVTHHLVRPSLYPSQLVRAPHTLHAGYPPRILFLHRMPVIRLVKLQVTPRRRSFPHGLDVGSSRMDDLVQPFLKVGKGVP
jgi:hypothetical protein